MESKFIKKFTEDDGIHKAYDINGYLCYEFGELRIKTEKDSGWRDTENFSEVLYELGEKIGISTQSSHGLGELHTCIPNVFITFFTSDNKISREECIEAVIEQLYGSLHSVGENFGWSEWTIEGCNLETLEVGGHDILKELKSHKNKYIHFIIKKGFSK